MSLALAPLTRASVVLTNGDPGTPGTPGSGPGTPGGNGGAGGDATASITVSGETLNQATANGGTGGMGGLGGSGASGGNGGAGGGATASINISGTNNIEGDNVISIATGGTGGGASGFGAIAGAGGTARATAFDSSSSSYSVTATQQGGAGGMGANGASGGAGTSSTINNAVSAVDAPGKANRLFQNAYGGNGGGTYGGIAGTAGSAVSIFTATTTGWFPVFYVNAYGGNGASGFLNANGSEGGAALASANLTGHGTFYDFQMIYGSVAGQATAYGGNGGDAQGIGFRAGNGGSATAIAIVTSSTPQYPDANSYAYGGNGGTGFGGASGGNGASMSANNVYNADKGIIDQRVIAGSGGGSYEGTPGAAGTANATISFAPSATTVGEITALVAGGNGGSAFSSNGASIGGLRGGDASLSLTVGAPQSFAPVAGSSTAGAGGSSVGNAKAGDGGNAFASVSGTSAGSQTFGLTLTATAIGGRGGTAQDPIGQNGNGGSATANALGISTSPVGSTFLSVQAFAYGGTAGGSSSVAGAAFANATGAGNGMEAYALAKGSSGLATAHSRAAAGLITNLTADTSSDVAGTSIAESRTQIGFSAQSATATAGLQAAAFVVASPATSGVTARLTSAPNVSQDFDLGNSKAVGPGSDALAIIDLASLHPTNDSSGAERTSSAQVTLTFDPSQLSNPQHLIVGLLSPTAEGAGFDSLHIVIQLDGQSVEDLTFNSIATANAFFNDDPLDLGALSSFPSGPVEMGFDWTLTGSAANSGYAESLIVGNAMPGAGAAVPEPAMTVVAFGVFAATQLRRSRRGR